ncbi:hypothetical protein [Zhihengliuella salsuginis]|uniref:hypothetical protein n=1 Tax=Zhihengliuella salsuginis TaxID=578222 RepID=UPI00167AE7AE|nr:hypothetical protein [Zhihengliuella salsuginis]
MGPDRDRRRIPDNPFSLALAHTLLIFTYRHSTGARKFAYAAFYNDGGDGMRVDAQTARLIKRVHHAATI